MPFIDLKSVSSLSISTTNPDVALMSYAIRDVLFHPAFQQIAPLVVLFIVPFLVLTCARSRVRFLAFNMLQGLGLSLSWLWNSNTTSRHPQASLKHKRKSRHVKNATSVEDGMWKIAILNAF